jgi:hypothetical protein
MVVSAVGQTGEVPSFADRLGERLVVAQPSGALLEFLLFHPQLSSATFFESSVKNRLKRLSNFRHAAYARATRLQRDPLHGNRLTLVSGYTAGRRLADVMVLARRGKVQPRINAVLSLAKQLMTGVALLHDYAPDVFHGALGPERLVVGPDGRLVITEYVLGTAVEQAVPEWGVPRLWRDYRLATLSDTTLTRFGRRIDLVQIGLVTLSLLVGRPLGDADFPGRLPELLDAARETTGEGEPVPLGAPLRDWLSKLLYIDPSSAFRTLIEAQKAFGRMLEEEPRYGVSSHAVESFFQQCEEAAALTSVSAQLDRLTPASGAVRPTPEPAVDVSEPPVEISLPPVDVATDSLRVPTGPPPLAGPGPALGPEDEVSVADVLATQPAAVVSDPAADPFGPWPVVVGSDTVATLFDTFNAPAASRESPAVSIPEPASSAEAAQEVPAPASAWAVPRVEAPPASPAETGAAVAQGEPEIVSNVWDAGVQAGAPEGRSDWVESTEQATARQLRQTLFEAGPPEPAPATPVERRAVPSPSWQPAAEEPAPAPPPWSEAFAPPSSSKVEVVVREAGAGEATAPEKPRPMELVSGERRTAAVLSYDEVHRTSPSKKSKTPLVWAAVLVVLAVAGVLGGPKIGLLLKGTATKSDEAAKPAAVGVGGFKITTQPPGGRVAIDGIPRGTAPLRVEDLAAGVHSIVVESEWGTVEEAVKVDAGKVTPLSLATVGWIKVDAPVELQVSEEGRSYGATTGPLMVPAGRHNFIFVNQSVAVRHRQFVQVPAGQTVKVTLDLPQGMMNLTSDQQAQVLVDGQLIGDAPQVSVPASLGPHEVIFRSPKYGDVSYSVNVTLAAPVSLKITFSAKR